MAPPEQPVDGAGQAGISQRSLVSEITLTFSGIVDNLDPSQLSLYTSDNPSLTVGMQVACEKIVGEETVVTLTFLPDNSGNDLTRQRELEEVAIQTHPGGSPVLDAAGNPLAALDPNTGLPLQLDAQGRPIYLNPDGTQEDPSQVPAYLATDNVLADQNNWTFAVPGAAVTQYAAHAVAGTTQSVPMAQGKVDQFWTLFGDVQGHRTVNGADMYYFREANAAGPGSVDFTALDYSGAGQLLNFDAIDANLNLILPPPEQPPFSPQ